VTFRSLILRALWGAVGAALGALAVLGPAPGALAAEESGSSTAEEAVAAAVRWLGEEQRPDGGFDSVIPGAETPDAILALAESTQTEARWSTRAAVERVETERSPGGQTPIDAVQSILDEAGTPGTVARAVTRVALPLGLDTGEEGPLGDLLRKVDRALADDEVAFADRLELGIAALAAGITVPEGMVDEVAAAGQANGGWNADGDPDRHVVDLRVTGAAVDFLVLAGADPQSEVVVGAVRLVASSEEAAGGWLDPDGRPDVRATAGAIRVIRAIGQDPAAECWRTSLGAAAAENSAVDFLIDQQRDNGRFPGRPPQLTTSEAVHALSGRWLPLGRVPEQCHSDSGGGPFSPSLIVLGVVAVVCVVGGFRIMRGGSGSV
jgi:hypothetical protein